MACDTHARLQSVAVGYSFFLAMTLNPDVQAKAQVEIDQVVGLDRLPTLADKDRLPYLNAVIKELLRWSPVAPLALPHAANEDGFYDGYFIPKDSILIPNVW
jgi:cytochrome P450